jgi:hypothetical protein
VRRACAALALVLALALSGCTVGSGEGWVRGSMFNPACGYGATSDGGTETSALDMPLNYFYGYVVGDQIDIRLQTGGAFIDVSDGLTISLRNRHDVVDAIRAGGSVTVPIVSELPPLPLSGPDVVGRVSLYLNSSCPDSYIDFGKGVGSITFTSMYARVADGDDADIDRIKATFTGLAFLDDRPEVAVGGAFPQATLDGEFDFDYTRGRPSQPFP